MVKLCGKDIYLAALERGDCRKICADNEHDFERPMEPFLFGWSLENSDAWFDEVQQALKADTHIRLGIFLNDGTVVGDVALQDIDRANRSCSLGMGIAKLENRGKGYGAQALSLILAYGFSNQGFERIFAETTEINLPAQKVLERLGFVLEGRERKAIYFMGRRLDNLRYSMLLDEYGLIKSREHPAP